LDRKDKSTAATRRRGGKMHDPRPWSFPIFRPFDDHGRIGLVHSDLGLFWLFEAEPFQKQSPSLHDPAPRKSGRQDALGGAARAASGFRLQLRRRHALDRQSVIRLGFEQIDVLFIHDVDRWTHGKDFPRTFAAAMEGAYRALDDLRKHGSVK